MALNSYVRVYLLLYIAAAVLVGGIFSAETYNSVPEEPKIFGSCKEMLANSPNEGSGVYYIKIGNEVVKAYCEMGLNGGGYTFLCPEALTKIKDEDLQAVITNRTSLLMRIRKCDGTQPYVVLENLPEFNTNLTYFHNKWTGFKEPQNLDFLGEPYLYAGFLPKVIADNPTNQGIVTNGKRRVFKNCDSNGNSYIALYPNFAEKQPYNNSDAPEYELCNGMFEEAFMNPSSRVMPPQFFMFAEFHFGGCGCYTQTDVNLRNKCILGFHIGFN